MKPRNDLGKIPWKKQVKEMMAEIRNNIRQDKVDLKFSVRHNEFDTALKLQIIIEESEKTFDDLNHIVNNCI